MHHHWTKLMVFALLTLTMGAAAHGPNHGAAQAVRVDSNSEASTDALDQEMANDNIYKAYFPSLVIARKAAISFHNQLLEANYEAGYLVLELTGDEITELKKFNFRFERATDFIAEREEVLSMMKREMAKRMESEKAAAIDGQKATIPTIPGYSCYETVEGTNTVADGFVTTYPSLANIAVIGTSWQKANSLGGYDLRVLKLTNSAMPGPKPTLFIQSAIHAREYPTAPLALEFVRWLTSGYGTVCRRHVDTRSSRSAPAAASQSGRTQESRDRVVVAQKHQYQLLRPDQQQPWRGSEPQLHLFMEFDRRHGIERQRVRHHVSRYRASL